MPVASRVYLYLFSAIFGDGQSAVNLKSLADDAVYDSANELKAFKKSYNSQRNTALPLYLTGFKSDSWDFHLGSVRAHGLSGFLDKEGINLVGYFVVYRISPNIHDTEFLKALQISGGWMNHCRNGAKVVLYRDKLFQRSVLQERMLLPETNTPDIHAQQAHRILTRICEVAPDQLMPNDLTPRMPFFLGKAVDSMLSGFIYGTDPEMFALGVEHALKGMGEGDTSINGKRGRRWMPLNFLAFAASFVRTCSFTIPPAYFLTSFLASNGTCSNFWVRESWRPRYKERSVPIRLHIV